MAVRLSTSLGQTRVPTSGLQMAEGQTVRRPGMALRVDPATNEDTASSLLLRMDERVHSSVRVRLAAAGLAMDDAEVWQCRDLLRGAGDDDDDGDKDAGPLWRLEQASGLGEAHVAAAVAEFRPRELALGGGTAYPEGKLYPASGCDAVAPGVFGRISGLGRAARAPDPSSCPRSPSSATGSASCSPSTPARRTSGPGLRRTRQCHVHGGGDWGSLLRLRISQRSQV